MGSNETSGLADEPGTTSRRTFLGATGSVLLTRTLPLGSLFGGVNNSAVAATLPTSRGVVYVDQVPVGSVVARGVAIANTPAVRMPVGTVPTQALPVRGVRAEPLEVEFSSGMSNAWYQWIADSVQRPLAAGKNLKRTGTLVLTGADGIETGRVSFTNALISAVSLPTLDAASKDSAAMTVRLAPETSQFLAAPSTPRKHVVKPAANAWRCANFRLKIKGLDSVTPWVVKVQPPRAEVEIRYLQAAAPGLRTAAGPVGLGKLVVTARGEATEALSAWFDQEAVQGPAQSRTATLELLGPDMTKLLGSVNLKNVGILEFLRAPIEANKDTIQQVQAVLYAESMTFDLAGLA